MTSTPEQLARQEIDRLPGEGGWHLVGVSDVDSHAAESIAVRELQLKDCHGIADFLTDVCGTATWPPRQERTALRPVDCIRPRTWLWSMSGGADLAAHMPARDVQNSPTRVVRSDPSDHL